MGAIVEHFVLNKIPRTSITGTVTDAISGEPVVGAQVRLIEDSRITPVLTDANGVYKLTEVFAGDYTVYVYHPEYESTTTTVNAVMDSPNQTDIALQPFVPYETELKYDDGIGEDAVSLTGTGVGYGLIFQPEKFAHVKAVRAYFWGNEFPNPGGNEISLVLMRVNEKLLPLNEPMFDPIPVTVKRGEWNTFDISHLQIHTDEPFMATFIQTKTGSLSPAIGIDNDGLAVNPFSYIFAGEIFRPAKGDGSQELR